tara:strand:+ start:2950 stop:4182 length:1233 start_codon:yes stop_codon:yes gene_type:complete
MKWLKNLLGFTQQEKELTQLKKSLAAALIEIKNWQKTALEIAQNTQYNIDKLQTQLTKKPTQQKFNFKVVDAVNPEFILFSLEESVVKAKLINNKPINNGKNVLRNLASSLPELVSNGLLAKSFRFSYPQGLSGNVMGIGGGQGTAIMNNGSIVGHGTYLSNIITTAPLAAFSIGNFIIRQHYLNKINQQLIALSSHIQELQLHHFVEKQAKVAAIKKFFSQCFQEFSLIEQNLAYKNALLTNIVNKNIEVFELITYYASVLNNPITTGNNIHREKELKAFLELQDLYLYGKLLSFQYANVFKKQLTAQLQKDIESVAQIYSEVLDLNKQWVQEELTNNAGKWQDWWLGKKKRKENYRTSSQKQELSLHSLKIEANNKFHEGQSLILSVQNQIDKPQNYLVENGEVYLIN